MGYQQQKHIKDAVPMKFDDDPALLLCDDDYDGDDDKSNNGWGGFQDYKTFQFCVKDSLREIAKKVYDFAEFVHVREEGV